MLSDVWALDFSPALHWERLAVTGAAGPRAGHTAIYESTRDRMVVFGGSETDRSTWALSFEDSTWSRLTPSGTAPGARSLHTAVYDAAHDRMIVFGGSGGGYPGQLDDLWYLEWSVQG